MKERERERAAIGEVKIFQSESGKDKHPGKFFG